MLVIRLKLLTHSWKPKLALFCQRTFKWYKPLTTGSCDITSDSFVSWMGAFAHGEFVE